MRPLREQLVSHPSRFIRVNIHLPSRSCTTARPHRRERDRQCATRRQGQDGKRDSRPIHVRSRISLTTIRMTRGCPSRETTTRRFRMHQGRGNCIPVRELSPAQRGRRVWLRPQRRCAISECTRAPQGPRPHRSAFDGKPPASAGQCLDEGVSSSESASPARPRSIRRARRIPRIRERRSRIVGPPLNMDQGPVFLSYETAIAGRGGD